MHSTNGMICPVCGEGTLLNQFKKEEFEYKEQKKRIENYPVLVCDLCQEEFIVAEDAKPFEKELTEFQREIDA